MQSRLLSNKRVVIHGGTGAIGAASARVFAREGAHVFVTGRDGERLQRLVGELRLAGGRAEGAALDVQDGSALVDHAAAVARSAGGIDILLNAVGVEHVQGVPFESLSLEQFMFPIDFYPRVSFLMSKAAVPYLVQQPGGVILTVSPPGSRLVGRGFIGSGTAFAGVEAFSRLLAAELGPSGVRVVCLRSHAIPEALDHGSHTRQVFERVALMAGMDVSRLLSEQLPSSTLTGRLPTLAEFAETAAFLASSRAAGITGTVVNLTCGAALD